MGGFQRLFIANRGEVAVRVANTCERMGITPVLAVSEADRGAAYTEGRETVLLGPGRSSESYLSVEKVVQAAVQSGCTALHPGWGFLSENPILASLCETHGVTFVGPPASVMHLMGKKTPAKRAMAAAGLTMIPGSVGVLRDEAQASEIAADVGFPVLLKAESGGGGRGMRIARSQDEVPGAFQEAQAEATAAFGDPRVYLERLLEGGRHVEIQVFADRYGNVVHLGERDCTVQRNHQKLVEEAPSASLTEAERSRTLEAAVQATQAIGYVGAGTMEFLLDDTGTLRFMEMNTRLQVEHTVSELRSGVDLVEAQILVAAGHRNPLEQDQLQLRGHAIECRINAEDPNDNFRPSPGTLTRFEPPEGPGIRVDTHARPGYVIPPHYDSLLAKLIVHGPDRLAAIDAMANALMAFSIEGVHTTIPLHLSVMRSQVFRDNRHTTAAIPGFSPQEAPRG